MNVRFLVIAMLVCVALSGLKPVSAQENVAPEPAEEMWWFPELPKPTGLLRTMPVETFGDRPREQDQAWRQAAEMGPMHMLVQSAAGLAARAVKHGEYDQMVWITTMHPNQNAIYERLTRRLKISRRNQSNMLAPWDLVKRLKDDGVVKGYILYHHNLRGQDDPSANVGTSVAGLLGGVLVEESFEEQAKALGLKMLLDAREHNEHWVFETHRDKLFRRGAMFQNPGKPHARDYAIAHDMIAVFGNGELEQEILAWMEPLSPIVGWNEGDEGENAKMFSQYSHFNTATDWSINLPILSAGAREHAVAKLPDAEPLQQSDLPKVSLVMSDGDNLQWMTQNFFADDQPRYWLSPYRNDMPYTWTLCLANMRQASPDFMDFTADTIPANATAVEFGGGYYFPDRFGELRDEPDLLAKQARKTWANMQAVNSDVLCLIFDEITSDDARKAMQVYADNMPGLKGILAMDYYPYSKGEGEVIWIERDGGEPLPVATCRLELRTDFKLPTTGGVADTAKTILDNPMASQWIVQHAWSSFEVPEGHGNPMPTRNDNDGRVTGLSGSAWLADALGDKVQLVTAQQYFESLTPPKEEASK